MSDKNFERKFRFDYTNEKTLRSRLEENVVKQIQSDPDLHEMIDDEYDVLAEDRNTVRTIFPRGDSKAGF